jgi:hypothetical protein
MGDEIERADNDLPPEWISDAPDTDPPKRSLLRELAEDDPGSGLVEIGQQVWYMPKLRPDRDKPS